MASLTGWLSGPFHLLARVLGGMLFAQHGLQKVFGLLDGHVQPLTSLAGIAGALELAGGLLIAVGLATRAAAFICAGEMAVAYLMVHAPHGFFPVLNKGELALTYMVIFLLLFVFGGGKWSLDGLLRKGKDGE